MQLFGDLRSPALMYVKAPLFLTAGAISAAALLWEHPGWRTAALLGISIWSFCRLYYFAFYVVEKYIDPGYRFAGIGSVLVYLLRRGRRLSGPDDPDTAPGGANK